MLNYQQNGPKRGTWWSIIDGLFAVFLYGGLTYVTWGRVYWIPTIGFVYLLLVQLISIPMEFIPNVCRVEPVSPFASQEEWNEWRKRDRRMRRSS
mmetsp:Transcript_57077/g.63811  ORF Transcript_57077/g.63811 Transcript_57077/m.63811 type:complete len:95 (+) Transcript_57077:85-369(+)